jgi:hypothetical protein
MGKAKENTILGNRTSVDSGALIMALNVLRRAGRDEVADELEATAIRHTEIRFLSSVYSPPPKRVKCKQCV